MSPKSARSYALDAGCLTRQPPPRQPASTANSTCSPAVASMPLMCRRNVLRETCFCLIYDRGAIVPGWTDMDMHHGPRQTLVILRDRGNWHGVRDFAEELDPVRAQPPLTASALLSRYLHRYEPRSLRTPKTTLSLNSSIRLFSRKNEVRLNRTRITVSYRSLLSAEHCSLARSAPKNATSGPKHLASPEAEDSRIRAPIATARHLEHVRFTMWRLTVNELPNNCQYSYGSPAALAYSSEQQTLVGRMC